MRFFKNDKKGKPSHIIYPEILHWQTDDEIQARNLNAKGWFSKMVAFENGNLNIIYLYKSLTSDGMIIVEEKETGELHKAPFRTFIKKAKNITHQNRKIMANLDENQEYMELLNEFQKAYNELQKEDNHPKQLGEPKKNKE